MTDCPTAEQIEKAITGVEPAEDVLAHLSTCGECRNLSARISEDVEFLHDVLRHAESEPGAKLASASLDNATVIPGYRLLDEIHRGGQGVVYKAIQIATRRLAAVKVLLDGPFASPLKRRRFEREIELISQMRHPHVVTVYDSGVTPDGRDYLAMEYVTGLPLDRFLAGAADEDDTKASRQDLLELFVRICEAVNYAHQRGVVHRDLKPGNILVDATHEPHVLDFGIAKAATGELLPDGGPLTVTGEFMGTLAYASPEQVTGDPDLVDVRTDVYSIGVMLYSAIAGRPPYTTSGSVGEVIKAIGETDPRPPSSGRQVPGPCSDADLDAIVLKALAKERDQRYQSAGELARDLRRALDGEPVEARHGSTWYVLKKLARRHRTGVSLAAAFVVLLVGSAMTSFALWRRADNALQLAEAGEQAAIREAGRSKQMHEFLTEMLSSIRPGRFTGPDVRVRDVVDEAARRLSEEFAGQPDLEAAQRETIAGTYHTLGLHQLATQHMARAVALREREVPDDPEGLVRVLIQLGQCRSHLGQLDEAEQVLQRAESLSSGAEPWAPELHALAALSMIDVDTGRGEMDRALARTQQAEPLIEAAYGIASLELADLLVSRSAIRFELGEDRQADEDLRRAERLLDELDEQETLLGAHLLQLRSKFATNADDIDGALEYLQRALETLENIAGEDHPAFLGSLTSYARLRAWRDGELPADIQDRIARAPEQISDLRGLGIADTWNELGLLAELQGRFAEAESHMRRSLELFEASLGGHALSTAFVMQNLGNLLTKRGRPHEAVPILRRALELERAALGPGDRGLLHTLQNLAYALQWVDCNKEARQLASEALEIARGHYPADHLEMGKALSLYGLTLIETDPIEAETVLLTACDTLYDSVGEFHYGTLTARHNLANCLVAQGETEEAEEIYRELIELYPITREAGVARAADVLNQLGGLLYGQKDYEGAMQAFTEGLELSRSAPDFRASQRVMLLNNLGAVQMSLKNWEAAERFILQAVAMGRSALPVGHVDRLTSLANLKHIYDSLDRREDFLAVSRERCEQLCESLGPENPRTISAVRSLAEELERLERDAEAEAVRRLIE